MFALILLCVVLVAAVGVLLADRLAVRSKRIVGRTVVVHTRLPDDRSIRGVLHAQYADRWTLRDAVLILPGGREEALGGVEHIPISNISFAQEMEAGWGVHLEVESS